jgi:3-methyladenine DNA glycosylase AlkD
MLALLEKELDQLKDAERGALLQRFFKTGKGQYGEGDIFLGLTVPQSRIYAKKYASMSYKDIAKLLASKIHEKRLIALLILVHNFEKGSEEDKKRIFDFYIKSLKHVNNWDLVDLSAGKIVGGYLYDRDRSILYDLAHSNDLWEKRVAIIASSYFIGKGKFDDTLRISEILLHDTHDLIHKAVGWMLREVGKRDVKKEREFLDKHAAIMPRTMLRYAIEKFPEEERQKYLKLGHVV